MGRHFITPLTTVHLSATVGVYGEALVGVDGDTEKAGVGLQKYQALGARRKADESLARDKTQGLLGRADERHRNLRPKD